MDARTLEVLHKRRYPGSLLTVRLLPCAVRAGGARACLCLGVQGARLKELNEAIAALSNLSFRQLLVDLRDGLAETISLYQNEMEPSEFALLVEML